MMRIPYGSTQLTSLEEDMNLLRKAVGYNGSKPFAQEQELLDEMKGKHSKKDMEYEADDEEDEDEDEDEMPEKGMKKEDEDYDSFYDELGEGEDAEQFFSEEDEDQVYEDEDEDYELTEEQAEEYAELIEAFLELDDEEFEGLTEEALEMVAEAVAALNITEEDVSLLMERRLKAGPAPKKGDPDYFKAKGKNTHGRMRRKTGRGVPFSPQGTLLKKLWRNFKLGGMVRPLKDTEEQQQTLALRAISKMAGPDYTARGMLEKFGKQALTKVEELRNLPDSSERAKKAREWLAARGGKLTSEPLLIRQDREKRRNESSDDLHNLIEDFRNLVTAPLMEDQEQDFSEPNFYEACEAIIEGFQNIGASAEEMSERICAHIRTTGIDESLEDPTDDARFELGSFFESIARDAGACLERIISVGEDGEPYFNEGIDPDTALEDLQTITSDFERGIAAMDELG